MHTNLHLHVSLIYRFNRIYNSSNIRKVHKLFFLLKRGNYICQTKILCMIFYKEHIAPKEVYIHFFDVKTEYICLEKSSEYMKMIVSCQSNYLHLKSFKHTMEQVKSLQKKILCILLKNTMH